jgi:hypothetical protein
VYLRVAELRNVRPDRSALIEAIELAVVGALCSTSALLIVGALADWRGTTNVHWFGAHPQAYIGHHPLRLLWLVSVALLVAYAIAYLAARITHRGKHESIRPGSSGWTEAMFNMCPKGYATIAAVELRDGRRVEGVLRAHMSTPGDENRELYLVAPIRVQPLHGSVTSLTDSFILLREKDILAIGGEYRKGTPIENGA